MMREMGVCGGMFDVRMGDWRASNFLLFFSAVIVSDLDS
jgi:hypothetical protein